MIQKGKETLDNENEFKNIILKVNIIPFFTRLITMPKNISI